MRHVILEEAGSLHILYEGPPLDLAAMGTMALEFQTMSDRVAIALLARAGLIEIPQPWLLYRRPAPFIRPRPAGPFATDELRPVRVMVQRISSQSPLQQDLIFAVATIFADPNARAVLQGIAANIVTGIGATGLRGLRRLFKSESSEPEHVVAIGPHLRSLAAALARNANGQRALLRVTYARGNERLAIEYEVEPDGG